MSPSNEEMFVFGTKGKPDGPQTFSPQNLATAEIQSPKSAHLMKLVCSGSCDLIERFIIKDAAAKVFTKQQQLAMYTVPKTFTFDRVGLDNLHIDGFSLLVHGQSRTFSVKRLAALSTYFDRMINGQFAESRQGQAELQDDPPLAASCMLQFLSQPLGDEPPTYCIPSGLGKYYELSHALLHAQVFALGEKYMIPSLCELAHHRFKKATSFCPELVEVYPKSSPFFHWSNDQQLLLMHGFYCGQETADVSLRNALVMAVADMSLNQTARTLSVREGYPGIEQHLVAAIGLIPGRDTRTRIAIPSALAPDMALDTIVSHGAGSGPSDWRTYFGTKQKLLALAYDCIDIRRPYVSWIMGHCLAGENSELDEYGMLRAWINVRHLAEQRDNQAKRVKTWEENLRHTHAKIRETEQEINDCEVRKQELEAKKGRFTRLQAEILSVREECADLDVCLTSFEDSRQALQACCDRVDRECKTLKTRIEDAQACHKQHLGQVEVFTDYLDEHRSALKTTQARFEVYSEPSL